MGIDDAGAAESVLRIAVGAFSKAIDEQMEQALHADRSNFTISK